MHLEPGGKGLSGPAMTLPAPPPPPTPCTHEPVVVGAAMQRWRKRVGVTSPCTLLAFVHVGHAGPVDGQPPVGAVSCGTSPSRSGGRKGRGIGGPSPDTLFLWTLATSPVSWLEHPASLEGLL